MAAIKRGRNAICGLEKMDKKRWRRHIIIVHFTYYLRDPLVARFVTLVARFVTLITRFVTQLQPEIIRNFRKI